MMELDIYCTVVILYMIFKYSLQQECEVHTHRSKDISMHGITSNDNQDAGCMQITDPTSFPNSNFDHLLMTGRPRFKCSIVPQSNCEDVELAIGETTTCSALPYVFETDGYGCDDTDYNCSAHIIIQVMSVNGISLHRMDSNYTGAMTFNGFERINLHYITCRQTSLKFKLPLTASTRFNITCGTDFSAEHHPLYEECLAYETTETPDTTPNVQSSESKKSDSDSWPLPFSIGLSIIIGSAVGFVIVLIIIICSCCCICKGRKRNKSKRYEDPKIRDEDADIGDGYANFGDVPSGHEKTKGYENQAIVVQNVDETNSKPAENATKTQEELDAMYAKPMKPQNRISTTNMEDNVMYQSGPNLPNREPENHAITSDPVHTDMEGSPANIEPNGDGGMNPYVLM